MSSLDFTVADHGTIQLLRPLTDEAKEWVNEHIPNDTQWHGHAVVVEHRYIEDIVIGIENDGLAVAYTH